MTLFIVLLWVVKEQSEIYRVKKKEKKTQERPTTALLYRSLNTTVLSLLWCFFSKFSGVGDAHFSPTRQPRDPTDY